MLTAINLNFTSEAGIIQAGQRLTAANILICHRSSAERKSSAVWAKLPVQEYQLFKIGISSAASEKRRCWKALEIFRVPVHG